jgi:hypothetical protein
MIKRKAGVRFPDPTGGLAVGLIDYSERSWLIQAQRKFYSLALLV